MPNELTFTLKKGATGSRMEVTLTDAAGALNLTGYAAVWLTVRASRDVPPVIEAAECVMADAENGLVRFDFADHAAELPVGEYDMEFAAVAGDGKVFIFPVGEYEYGRLVVQRSLGVTPVSE